MKKRQDNTSEMLAVGGYFLLQLAASFAVAALASAYFYVRAMPEGASGDALYQALSDFTSKSALQMTIASNAIILLALFIISRAKKRSFLEHCRLKAKPRSAFAVAICALAGATANFWLSFVINSGLIPESMLESYEAAYQPISSGSLPLELFTLIIVAPLVEEIIYRGIILGHLKNIVPIGAAIVFQGLLFGCVHGDPLWIAYACALGCVIGLVRVRCASVWAGVAFHMAFNGTSYLFIMFSDAAWDIVPLRITAFIVSALAFVACMWKICTPPRIVK